MLPISAFLLLFLLLFSSELAAQLLLAVPARRAASQPQRSPVPDLCLCPGSALLLQELLAILMLSLLEPQSSLLPNRPHSQRPTSLAMNSAAPRNRSALDHQGLFGSANPLGLQCRCQPDEDSRVELAVVEWGIIVDSGAIIAEATLCQAMRVCQ